MGRRLCGEDEYSGPLLAVAGYQLPGAGRAFPRSHAESFLEAALPGVHDAGRPYVDWLFGGPDEARAALRSWMARPSSEVYAGRAVLLIAHGAVVGGFIALSGDELARCHQSDVVAALGLAGRDARRSMTERIKIAQELFPPVAPDEFYLSKIWVSPDAQGAGHGAALLRHYVDTGTQRGFTRFRLDVWSGNDAAIRLYRRFGFETLQEPKCGEADIRYTSMVANFTATRSTS